MDIVIQQKLIKLIASKIGFHIKNRDINIFEKIIQDRVKILKLSNIWDYYNLLKVTKKESNITWQQQYKATKEWDILANQLTNGESFFFRDRGQFELLKETIFPELITQKRSSNNLSLKIWSSGCSTGQEPYSLAILLSELIPDLDRWQITIIGTDINQQFLKQAKNGIYQSWSFRLSDPAIQRNYFTATKSGWQINSKIKKMVVFCHDNIVQNQHIPTICYEVDLVICRNVFIYFQTQAIQAGIDKFASALNTDGYLMTGHGELHTINLEEFEIISYPQSTIYQKKAVVFNEIEQIQTNLHNLPSLSLDSVSTELETLLLKQQYNEIENIEESIISPETQDYESYYQLARTYMEQDNLEQGKFYAEKVLGLNSMFVPALYLMAQIAESRNNLSEAKKLLKRIIYLDDSSVKAYLELAAIYIQNNELKRGEKTYYLAHEILKTLSPEAELNYRGMITVAQIREYVEEKLLDKNLC